jgi:hypothetical protein
VNGALKRGRIYYERNIGCDEFDPKIRKKKSGGL